MTNEQRLKALEEYRIFDTLPEKEFDDIIDLASAFFDMPISLITLLDSKRQWFKARMGIEIQEMPVEEAFCQYTIQFPDKVMVVKDSRLDKRFERNPLVTGQHDIRFYAGASLVSPDGHSIGTICLMDNQPRSFSKEQKRVLKILAIKVMRKMELRKKNLTAQNLSDLTLETTLARLLEAQNITHIGSWDWNVETRELFLSPEMHRLYGMTELENGRLSLEKWGEMAHPDDFVMVRDAIDLSIRKAIPYALDYRIINKDGSVNWVQAKGVPTTNSLGETIRLLGTVQDITEKKSAENTKQQYTLSLEEMLFALSHKIRSPVSTYLGLINVMNEEQLSPEKVKQYSGYFKTVTEELDVCIRELSEFLQEKKINL